jgi:RNA polymerase sigma-70 factor (ECF subfamily)
VVQAVVLDGLTTKEAGRLLGFRENTVKTRLHRAKAQLRATLTEPQEGWR